ncbi:hybrid sensor histidine kinase/response regulator [Marinobacterium jannaschii]|uniref:hybrid sensor histidine kinase/response regulator n=1 Tax=Marinobacterium jannaschii TaxID=64970 RepID=UPI00068838B4|nr:hybrid sensor histidine kinase/response regulator [Marinobacterium jannaschii]
MISIEKRVSDLGNLSVTDRGAVLKCRNNLRALVEYLQFSPVEVSKLLSTFSELTCELLKGGQEIVFDVKLVEYDSESGLSLEFCTPTGGFSYPEQALKTAFNRVIVRPADNLFHVQLVSCFPKPVRELSIEKACAILNRLTEKEYLHELTLAGDAANAATKAKSEFLAAMSHEIRTPMNGVIGMAEVLAKSNLDESQVQSVRIIQDSAFSLLRIIDEILDFSKMDAGRLELERTQISIRELLEGTCASLSLYGLEKYVDISLFIHPQVPDQIWSDPTRLRQVLNNLIGNAIKFCDGSQQSRGQVGVRLDISADSESQLTFSVIDNGIGIAPDILGTLFTSFQQAEQSTTRRFGGTGLGLAISKGLVELMQGDIAVESSVGEGSTFTFTLPLERVVAGNECPDVDLSGLTCIVLESDSGNIDDHCAYLEYAGASVRRVTDLGSALALAENESPRRAVIINSSEEQALQLTIEQWIKRRLNDIGYVVLSRSVQPKICQQAPAVVSLGYCVLRYRDLLRAVAVAAGLTSADVFYQGISEEGQGENIVPPTTDDALAQGRLILVAEDDRINQSVILRQLGLLGYAAEVAGDGREALSKWRNRDYALLLTDLHMPEMDGYQLAEAVRSEEKSLRHKPIVALTANALRGEKCRTEAAGMDDYLTKPIQLQQLSETLEKWLAPADKPEETSASGIDKQSAAEAVFDVEVLKSLVGDEPAVVFDLLTDYLDSVHLQLDELRSACAQEDVQTARGIAHKLKSTSRTMGALMVGERCAELEDTCENGQIACIAKTMQMLESSFSAAEAQIVKLLHSSQA